MYRQVEIIDIIEAFCDLNYIARTKDVVNRLIYNFGGIPNNYRSYQTFYGTVSRNIQWFCPDSKTMYRGKEAFFNKKGKNLYAVVFQN